MNKEGFTLAELLISLAILGIIATFTIPKVLSSLQDGRYKSIAKEGAATMTSALLIAQQKGVLNSGSSLWDLTPYMNYVTIDTTSGTPLTDPPGTGSNNRTCSAGWPCIHLHNGANIITGDTFGGTASTNMIWFWLDPDAGGPMQSAPFALYYNGRVTTFPYLLPGSTSSYGLYSPVGTDPVWFNWN